MKVAVVQNRNYSGVINNFGQKCPEVYGASAIRNAVTALCEDDHDVLLCEGDNTLLSVLGTFMPADANGQPTGMVFNMA